MQQPWNSTRSLLVLVVLACSLSSSTAQSHLTKGELKYVDLANWGANEQFKIAVSVGSISSGDPSDDFDDGTGRELTGCPAQAYRTTEPNPRSEDQCNYPPIKDGGGDVVKVKVGLRGNSIKCVTKGPDFSDENRACDDPSSSGGVCEPSEPTHIEARLCYSEEAYTNRPWRKKSKPYTELSLNCPWLLEKIEVNPSNLQGPWTATKFFSEFDEVPSATYYVMVHALTSSDEKEDKEIVCGWDDTEKSTYTFEEDLQGNPRDENQPATYVLTEVQLGRTPGIIAAAVVFTIFSVCFLITYTIADTLYFNKTGKMLTFSFIPQKK